MGREKEEKCMSEIYLVSVELVCSNCGISVKNWETFRAHDVPQCQYTRVTSPYQNYSGNSSALLNVGKQTYFCHQRQIAGILELHHVGIEYVCSRCKSQHKNMESVDQHMEQHKVECQHTNCGMTFKYLQHLNMIKLHVNAVHVAEARTGQFEDGYKFCIVYKSCGADFDCMDAYNKQTRTQCIESKEVYTRLWSVW